MADTPTLRSALVTLFADNTGGDVSPQDLRNFLISALLRTAPVTFTTAAPTIDDDDFIILLDTTSNNVTASLPADPSTDYYPLYIVKAIDASTNTAALDPGTNNLDGSTTDYTFADDNDCIIVGWDGSEWRIYAEFLNA